MSNKYSLGGYKIAIQARTRKTLLVEGKDDKELFKRLNLHISPDNIIDIDAAEILSGTEFAGLGAKAKVDAFLSNIPASSPILTKFRTFVDREWENLVDQVTGDSRAWTPPVATGPRITSSGHSIENYSFYSQFILEYIAHFGSGTLTPNLQTQVQSSFADVLNLAAAFSEISRRRNAITRCCDVMQLGDVTWDGSKFILATTLVPRLRARQIVDPAGFVNDVMHAYTTKWSAAPWAQESHWHTHGHIGEMTIWVAIAAIAAYVGVPNAQCDELAFGRKDERRRFWHTWLMKVGTAALSPMDQALA
ncbi:hypothetical protein MMA231_03572 (plasmid) [Asticcacaulis sp. MM231]|uniref:hypothetical protein n=1 Tax=Asticcacaulis sp. MM231 TaxID=3157666 RepID=UPI0032D5A1AC